MEGADGPRTQSWWQRRCAARVIERGRLHGAVVGLSGFEPLTSRLSGGRSNQLSYRPDIRGGRARQLPHSCADAGNQVGWPSSPCELLCLPSGFRRKSNSSVRKEVIQPQVPLRLPCYDLVPITKLALGAAILTVWQNDFEHSPLSWLDGRCVQGSGTYSPRHG